MYVEFTAFQTCVLQSHGLIETDREREAFYRGETRDCRSEGGGREKRVRRIAEWKAVLTVDCLFGNYHPETWNRAIGVAES